MERGEYSVTSKTEIILDTLLHFFHKIYTYFKEKCKKIIFSLHKYPERLC